MAIIIRPAQPEDVGKIINLVNRFAAQNVMLPRTEESVRQTLPDWLVAVEYEPSSDILPVVACGALVSLTDTLVEIRSLAVDESQHGKGVGSQIVLQLVELAKEREYQQVCALTLRENFFTRLGFELVDRWSISPKVWQACIYCPKFHRCDEVAVLMNLVAKPAVAAEQETPRPAGWNHLLKWEEWQPLRLAYKRDPHSN
ncbi:MAG: GNAT family N-acetyltransferase [Chloroflexi bacterium]|jgi:amino-acid N-acetyltransferase|nr:GNAT family N-acetyltransferase [Chloroflexota bacterium]